MDVKPDNKFTVYKVLFISIIQLQHLFQCSMFIKNAGSVENHAEINLKNLFTIYGLLERI